MFKGSIFNRKISRAANVRKVQKPRFMRYIYGMAANVSNSKYSQYRISLYFYNLVDTQQFNNLLFPNGKKNSRFSYHKNRDTARVGPGNKEQNQNLKTKTKIGEKFQNQYTFTGSIQIIQDLTPSKSLKNLEMLNISQFFQRK